MEQTATNSEKSIFNTDGGRSKSNAVEIPSINLPKGGGALRGIDEKFTVNAVNGTSSFSIPLPFSASRGASPNLTITYNSGAGNGIFGMGWSLNIPSIKRKTDKALPQYNNPDDPDTFLLSEAEDLVPEFKKDDNGNFIKDAAGGYILKEIVTADGLFTIRYYKPRIEGSFARIEQWTENASGLIKWRVITRDNVTTLFGWSQQAVIADPADDTRIFEWFPEFISDNKGNCVLYKYKKEDPKGLDILSQHNRNRLTNGVLNYTNLYPEKILYGNKTPYKQMEDPYPPENDFLFSAIFDYGEYRPEAPFDAFQDWSFRTDAFSGYRPGFEIRTTRLCKRILFYHHFQGINEYDGLVKSLNFEYSQHGTDLQFLASLTSWGYIKKADGSYTSKSLPPVEFEYQHSEWNREVKTVQTEDLMHAPAGIDNAGYMFTDLYNEGLAGILTEQATGWYYKHNLGEGKFTPARAVATKPSFAGLSDNFHLADLDANGGRQFVSFSTEPKGFFELDSADNWNSFHQFQQLPNIDFSDAYTRMIDLNGDGKPELLVAEDNVFTWYESEGRDGFSSAQKAPKPSNEEEGPHMIFADEEQTIYLADMSGDGLTDIVRIRNGEVSYWPNLGYGRFGARVAIDNAPVFDFPDAFNPVNLRLADIDGSGTSDIIYLGKNNFCCWKNLSGNGFDPVPFETNAFPEVNNYSSITVADLLGNGTACIVISDSLPKNAHTPMKYIDLMNSRKPHIMTSYKNNTGKEVYLDYAPSTNFYLEDKHAGNAWVTKLHFPVHCVAKIRTLDKITGCQFTSEYKYHHGYYDHAEQEFRGFGMVEQYDTETFENWAKGSASNIVEETLHQAPVLTKSWFHTGAFLERDKILGQFSKDYWYERLAEHGFPVTNHELALTDAEVIAGPGIAESVPEQWNARLWQEALRACKGMNLRSEIFSLDVPLNASQEELQKQLTPYSVASNNCIIKLLQPKGKNKHAVFSVIPGESLAYGYERNTADPGISHTINIKSDEYGNILEAAAIVYPRLLADASLPQVIQQEQIKTSVIYTLNRFTNDVINDSTYQLRLPSETQTYELTEVPKQDVYYKVADFESILNTAIEIPYHLNSDQASGVCRKRLIEHSRSYYYNNDLKNKLPLHSLGSLPVPFESYQLAYTPELATLIFENRLNDNLLAVAGYIHTENDLNWWIRSGTVNFLATAENVTDAQNRFYMPVSFTDAIGTTTKVKHDDSYFLYIKETEDDLGNKTIVEKFNFRTLSPQRTRDMNNNLSEAITDELGLLKAMAIYGKGNEADDLSGITEETEQQELDIINQFFNAPDTAVGITDSHLLNQKAAILLQHATVRCVYDFNSYQQTGNPVVVSTITREEHFKTNPGAPLQIGFEYSGGLGNVVMQKSQATPGVAKKLMLNGNNSYSVSEVDTAAQNPPLLRWIGNGRTILNNKGNPVKQYEPYFSVSHRYEDQKELVETGVTPIMYYDAPGRLIKTEMPNGTFTFTEFDAWKQKLFDANDTVLQSHWYHKRFNRLIDAELLADGKNPEREKAAAEKTAAHANTPSVQYFDSLGRVVLNVEHNKTIPDGNDQFFKTKLKFDIEGNLLMVTDAREMAENGFRGNAVMQYKYDMLGRLVYQNSMDAGQRWMFMNVLGAAVRTWDERNHEFQYFYDVLHRPTMSIVVGNGDGSGPLNHIYDRVFYGESQPDAELKNLRGQVTRHYDTAGLVEISAYTFKGQPVSSTRKLFGNYKAVANWTDANLVNDLENESFTFASETDALGRLTKQTSPDGSLLRILYNEAGLLTSETVKHIQPDLTVSYIQSIDYNEKGQRKRITFGNNVSTRYFYDRETFGLIRLETKRQNNEPLNDWHYTFDPVGNITHIEDKNIPAAFFNNQMITGISEYTYDALYRLRAATGRENDSQLNFGTGDNWDDNAYMKELNPGDPMMMRNFRQIYQYDEVGNILLMKHDATANNWVRNYEYDKFNNRLIKTVVGSQTYHYGHHSRHGYMLNMPHLQEMEWNFREELIKSIRQKVNPGSGTPETTWYQYDGGGQRIRKITENSAQPGANATRKDERIYFSGYETYRKYQVDVISFERETLSLMDEGHRFVMVETVKSNSAPAPDPSEAAGVRLTRYQHHNHLGSAALELDDLARLISYEEYHPFGTTAFQAKSKTIKAASKRYRYTGMERDEETGLEYHSARYYLPWLGRWLSADPIGINGGINLFGYAYCNPITYSDTQGSEPDEVKEFLPGTLADYPHLGNAWKNSAEVVLENRYGKGNYAANLKAFHSNLNALPEGSKRSALARKVFDSVRSGFYRRVGKLYEQGIKALGNIDLPADSVSKMLKGSAPRGGLQIDHAIDELAIKPHNALDPTNLGIRRGHAGVPGGSHFKATEGRKGLRTIGRVAKITFFLEAGAAAARVGDRLLSGDFKGAAREVGAFAYDQTIGTVKDIGSLAKDTVKFISDPLKGVRDSINELKKQQDDMYASFDEIFGGNKAKASPDISPVVVNRPVPKKPDRGNAAQGLMILFAAIVVASQAPASSAPAAEESSNTGSGSQSSGTSGGAYSPFSPYPLCSFWTPTGIPFNLPRPCF